jgi:plasmid stabilization system protein ParE
LSESPGIFWSTAAAEKRFDVVRVLHDARDLERHLPEDYLPETEA